MPGQDAIALALGAPIDWEKFEQIAYELLSSDDLPRLRRLGGRHDRGVDAAEEVFYGSEQKIGTVVQVTAVQVSGDPAGGSGHFLGYWTRSGQGRDEVPGFCCPD